MEVSRTSIKVASMTEMATIQGLEAGTAAGEADEGERGGVMASATTATGGSSTAPIQALPGDSSD
jgi:hypothetical protein